jgi:hypothetical protein
MYGSIRWRRLQGISSVSCASVCKDSKHLILESGAVLLNTLCISAIVVREMMEVYLKQRLLS